MSNILFVIFYVTQRQRLKFAPNTYFHSLKNFTLISALSEKWTQCIMFWIQSLVSYKTDHQWQLAIKWQLPWYPCFPANQTEVFHRKNTEWRVIATDGKCYGTGPRFTFWVERQSIWPFDLRIHQYLSVGSIQMCSFYFWPTPPSSPEYHPVIDGRCNALTCPYS